MTHPSDTIRRDLPSGFELEHESGKISVHELAPGVILQEYEDAMVDAFFDPVIELAERRIAAGLRLTLISDISRSGTLSPAYRKAWSSWVGEHGEHIDAVYVLLSSPLQRMAVNAANAATGGSFTAFTDIEEFQTAVETAVLAAETAAEAIGYQSDRARERERRRSAQSSRSSASMSNAEGERIMTVRLPSTETDLDVDMDSDSDSDWSATTEPSVGTVLADAYRLDERIGRGGMGTVYRATQLSLQREVAVKLIRLDRRHNPGAYARFAREIDLVSRLSHPHIVQVYDAGEAESGAAFFVMELLEGRRLDRHVIRGGLPREQAVALFRQLCAGVEAAHAKGLVHRDLSPANVFVVETGAEPQIKILDFGLAKSGNAKDQGLTLDGQVLGTPGFMAPEQMASEEFQPSGEVDRRTDVYALGAVLYYMLAGRRAFIGKTAAATISLQLRGEYLPLPRIHQAFSPVVARALALDPDDRPASVAELRQTVEAAANEPPPPEPSKLKTKLTRYFPWLVVAGLFLAAATLFGLTTCS